MGRTVGIDLGTTNSLVAYLDAKTGEPKCIPGPTGSTLCPSVVSLDADGSIIVGEPARQGCETLLVAGNQDEVVTALGQTIGIGRADACRRAGDQGGAFGLDRVHVRLLHRIQDGVQAAVPLLDAASVALDPGVHQVEGRYLQVY